MSQQAGREAETNTKESKIMKRKIRHLVRASAASLRVLVSVALENRPAQQVPIELHHERSSVFCIASSRQADQIVRALTTAQFSGQDISVVSQDQGMTDDFARGKPTKAVEGTVVGAGMGGVVGGALGWLVGLAIPAVLGSAPWVVGLSLGVLGAVVTGIAGGKVGRGIPRFERGDILIAVQTRNSGDTARVQSIFTDAGAQDGCQRRAAYVEELPPPVWSRRIRHSLAQPVLAEILPASA